MPVEQAKYVNQLNPEHPAGGESISEGDDHLRVIKTALTKSFPNIDSEVTATPAQLNEVGFTAALAKKNESDLADLRDASHVNVASCYFGGGSVLYEYNVSGVTKTPNNDLGTRITFKNALEGPTPEHYSFSITPVSIGGLPISIHVSTVTSTHIDFIALQFQNEGGDWVYMEGTTADFSLIVIDMEAGQ